jgi:hypothetical protein
MKTLLLLLVPLSSVAFSGLAFADDAPAPIQVATPAQPAPPITPQINLDTPAVGRPVQRTYHLHEGFYLRSSVGFGDYRASFSDGNDANRDFTEKGSSMSLDLLIGGSPSPGVSIGGALLLEPLFGADYQRGSTGVGSHGGFSTLLGPFIDGFPDATKGWHLGGMLGLAAQSFQNVNDGNGKTATAGGIGGAAWFGYDFWVASEWAIGPQLRLMGMRTSDSRDGNDVSAWARSFTLGISGVYN